MCFLSALPSSRSASRPQNSVQSFHHSFANPFFIYHTSLSFSARATAAARLCTPSFVNRFRVCVLVV